MTFLQTWLAQQADRIDALSQRERLFLFVSALAIIIGVADTFWLSPALTAQRQLVLRFSAQTQELNQLRTDLQASGMPTSANASARDDVARVNARLDELDQEIKRLIPNAQTNSDLEHLLVQFLRQEPGLTLLGTRTLQDDTAVPAAAPPVPGAAALPVGLRRQGMELRVTGAYADLVRYVKALETGLPGLRWGSMVLRSEGRTPELNLQVYVVGVQP